SRHGKKGDGCCSPAPAPAPTCCDSCASKPSLLDRMRAHFRKRDDCCGAANTGCCGAGAPGAVIVQPGKGHASIPGTIPQGTFATTPAQPKAGTAAPTGTPINAQPITTQPSEPRQKLPAIDGKGTGPQAAPPASPKPTVTTTPVVTPTAATVETETQR